MKLIFCLILFSYSYMYGSIELARNPFKPVAYTAASISEEGLSLEKIDSVLLTGVVWDETLPYAIISAGGIRQIIKQGDIVDIYTVKKIHINDVVLKHGSKTLILEKGKVSKLK